MALTNYLGSGKALPPEKLVEMKQIIHDHIRKMDLHSTLKDSLETTMVGGGGGGGSGSGDVADELIDETRLLSLVKEKGILDKILVDLGFDSNVKNSTASHFASATDESAPLPVSSFSAPRVLGVQAEEEERSRLGAVSSGVSGVPTKTRIDPKKRHLYLQFLGGRAFIEYMNDSNGDIGGVGTENDNVNNNATSTLTLDVFFRGQRFRSRPASCACEPDLKEGFLLQLHDEADVVDARMATASKLLVMQDPIHIVVVKTDVHGEMSLVSRWLDSSVSYLAGSVIHSFASVLVASVPSSSYLPSSR